MKYKWDTTLSFRLWVSKEQTPTGFRANVVYTEMHFQPISCQYPSRNHTMAYHIIPHRMSSSQKSIHPLHLQSTKIGNWKCEGWAWANCKAFQKAGDKDTMSSHLESRDTKGLHSLSADGIVRTSWCLVTEVFVFKASASAWPKGKRHGSRSRLTSVRRHEIQMRHNSQFPTFRLWVSKEQFPLDSGQMSLTQTCTSSQYHANIPVESIPGIPHHTTQNEFKSTINWPTSLTVN